MYIASLANQRTAPIMVSRAKTQANALLNTIASPRGMLDDWHMYKNDISNFTF
jgi:hypothetical protein